ncbi:MULTISPECIES: methyltransferase domain-containing protein [unclassified Rubrivivax]|uniref:methyltransferase domain-containing protein n=1 Tax=unclassified Rubrivivax TaxID=2649762 RepID=UPI001E604D99|nr:MULTISPECIES: methyltransferase domain-containing protein [unclassified Rubrivivax]MCC9595497.1 class I SAM-dependent methyltransferase [Rubrivivax sp. JA1055]MCC9646996.1 class I SAM-dependent methyltransferase [Rubrivivax sp. JA1029]
MSSFQVSNFGEILHASRTKMLERLPRGVGVFCSAGCSGLWYFDWVEKALGPIGRHVGVELYSPKPDGLPRNVQWIAASVSNMTGVATESADVLFSGQNIEHLFPQDVVGFLSEANRVLKTGGTLCIDSPNRAITQHLSYSQPEHVLEFTVDEARELVTAAGFTVTGVHGIWHCLDDEGRVLAIDHCTSEDEIETRLARAETLPRESFIWWLTATKSGPVSPDFKSKADSVFMRQFPGFVRSRYRLINGEPVGAGGSEAIVRVDGQSGYIFHGPYIPLAPGRYVSEFHFEAQRDGGALRFDVCSNFGKVTHAETSVPMQAGLGWQTVRLAFEIDRYTTAVECRAIGEGGAALLRFGALILPTGCGQK